MTRTLIKCCGFTRADDIERAAALGVDYIGLILAPRSPRRLTLDAAQRLRERVPARIGVVALVMDQPEEEVCTLVAVLAPDIVQFHGVETDAFCAAFGVPFWKALAMGGEPQCPWEDARARWPSAAALVFDGHTAGEPGGSGQRFDWSRLPDPMHRPDAPRIVLAGGLTADTVGHAIGSVKPWCVDVSSGIELAPGIKDAVKLRAFVEAVRNADRRLSVPAS